MHSHKLITLVVLLASLVSAVDIGTAFVRDFVKYLTPGFLETEFIASNEFVSLEGEGILTRRKVIGESPEMTIDSELVWAVDLRQFQLLDLLLLKFHVATNEVFVYGPSLSLAVIGLDDGSLISNDKSIGKINWVGSAPGGNVYAATDDGNLLVVNDDGTVRSIDLNHYEKLDPSSSPRFLTVNAIDYIVLDSGHIFKITDSVLPVGHVPGVINVGKSAIVAGNNHVFRISTDGTLTEISHQFLNPTIVTTNDIVDIDGSKLLFYKINDDNTADVVYTKEEIAPISGVHAISNDVNEILVVDLSPSNLKILVLTDYLANALSDTIKEFNIGSSQKFEKSIILSSENTVLTSSIEDSNLFVETINWSTGRQELRAIFKVTVDPKSILIVDKPNVATESLELALLATESSSIFVNWLARTKRHLSAIGKLATSVIVDHRLPTNDDSGLFPEIDFGFDKLVLFFDLNSCRVVAMNTKDGSKEWTTEKFCTASDSQLLGMFIANDDVVVTLEQHVHRFNLHDGLRFGPARFTQYGYTDAIKLKAIEAGRDTWVLRNGKEFTRYGPFDFAGDQIVITNEDNVKLQAYISTKGKFIPTWSFGSSNEKIIKHIGKPEESTTSSIGVVLHDKSVLYKYLYPNTVSVITSNEEGIITFYLLDGVKGEILYTFKHDPKEVLDVDSIEVLMDDNWIIYTYFVFEPRFEQRITVLDLFDNYKNLGGAAVEQVSAFDRDLKITNVSQQAYTYPDRIIKLKSTVTKHGITLKSVIALTENGALVEFPKWVLNSRRVVGRQLTKEDMMSDFRPLQYEPVVPRNTKQILNHKFKVFVDKNGTILTKDTNLESTSVVCYINSYNMFCTIAQPSRSWDVLGSSFDKNKLAITILVLIMAYITSTLLVTKKSLHDSWHDSS